MAKMTLVLGIVKKAVQVKAINGIKYAELRFKAC